MPAESVIERLRQISATFDEERPAMVWAAPGDGFARNKHGDALDFDAEETALIINALPLLLAVAEAAELLHDACEKRGENAVLGELVYIGRAVRALRAGGSDV